MSDNALQVAQYAVRLAHNNKSDLTVVNVVGGKIEELSTDMQYDLSAHCDNECLDSMSNDYVENGKKVLRERINSVCGGIINSIDDCLVEPEVAVRAGEPVEQIVDEARENNADLIVVGARGHNILDEILVGSVARGVVKKSPVPVMTIPLGKM